MDGSKAEKKAWQYCDQIDKITFAIFLVTSKSKLGLPLTNRFEGANNQSRDLKFKSYSWGAHR
jgi:hypothetical protein